MTVIAIPKRLRGFIIDLDNNTFIEQPPDNTLTVDEVIAENNRLTPAVRRPITEQALLDEIAAERGDVIVRTP